MSRELKEWLLTHTDYTQLTNMQEQIKMRNSKFQSIKLYYYFRKIELKKEEIY